MGYQVKKRVLVIDDIGIILDLVAFLLQMDGYEVVTATDAASALAQIETTKPDLILLDVMMPKSSGNRIPFSNHLDLRPGERSRYTD